jgi:hypothetical protein
MALVLRAYLELTLFSRNFSRNNLQGLCRLNHFEAHPSANVVRAIDIGCRIF